MMSEAIQTRAVRIIDVAHENSHKEGVVDSLHAVEDVLLSFEILLQSKHVVRSFCLGLPLKNLFVGAFKHDASVEGAVGFDDDAVVRATGQVGERNLGKVAKIYAALESSLGHSGCFSACSM